MKAKSAGTVNNTGVFTSAIILSNFLIEVYLWSIELLPKL